MLNKIGNFEVTPERFHVLKMLQATKSYRSGGMIFITDQKFRIALLDEGLCVLCPEKDGFVIGTDKLVEFVSLLELAFLRETND